MENLIVIAVVGLIVGLAGGYLYKEKKRGVTCVGCPYHNSCRAHMGCSNNPANRK